MARCSTAVASFITVFAGMCAPVLAAEAGVKEVDGSEPFPARLEAGEVRASLWDADSGELLLVIQVDRYPADKPRKRFLNWRLAPPLEVWKVPVDTEGLVLDQAQMMAKLPGKRPTDLASRICRQGDTVYCAYVVETTGFRDLSFQAISLTRPSVPKIRIWRTERILDAGSRAPTVIASHGLGSPEALDLLYADGRRVQVPAPIAIYFDSGGRLCILGGEAGGHLFEISSEDKGKTWSKARPVSGAPKAHTESARKFARGRSPRPLQESTQPWSGESMRKLPKEPASEFPPVAGISVTPGTATDLSRERTTPITPQEEARDVGRVLALTYLALGFAGAAATGAVGMWLLLRRRAA